MPVVNVNLLLDEDTYAAVNTGALELCGMVKDHSHKVRKHLPTVGDAAKEGASKALDIVMEHKKSLLIVGGIVVAGGAIAGAITYYTTKEKRKAKKKFGESLNVYLHATQEGLLTSKTLDDILNSLDMVCKVYKNDTFPLKLFAKQFSVLLNSLYDYTNRLARANNFDLVDIKAPKKISKHSVIDLRQYLVAQKQILNEAA